MTNLILCLLSSKYFCVRFSRNLSSFMSFASVFKFSETFNCLKKSPPWLNYCIVFMSKAIPKLLLGVLFDNSYWCKILSICCWSNPFLTASCKGVCMIYSTVSILSSLIIDTPMVNEDSLWKCSYPFPGQKEGAIPLSSSCL